MISDYSEKYFDFLSENIIEFDINYLKVENPFLRNFVYLENDVPIGIISYSLIYDRIELEYIWVNSSYRHMGIASKLMDKMIDNSVNNITLEVRTSNVDAINLYKKFGFKIASIRKCYYGDEDAYLMIREMM